MTDRNHIPQEDLALYAMQTLSQEESVEVRTHLATCALCRDELAELSGDLAMVALSVEQHPVPEGARQRFLDRVAASSSEASQKATAGQPGPWMREQQSRSPMAWLPWAAVAALVIAVVSLGVKNNSLHEQLRDQSGLMDHLVTNTSHAQQVLEVLTAPSAQRATLTASKTPVAPTGRAVYLADRGGLIFQANNLEPLPANKTYELWVVPANSPAPIPAGLFRPDATGTASVVLPPLPKGVPARAFAITIERAEGSATPTAPIILSGAASGI
jgi:anti-sigma-K factor RskA